MAGASNSPYRVGNWTVTKLKDELRQRNLPSAGNKSELIERLERHDVGGSTASPRRTQGRTSRKTTVASLSPTKSARSRSVSPQKSRDTSLPPSKDQIRSYGLSPHGKKQELKERLERAKTLRSNPFVDAPSPPPPPSTSSSPGRNKAAATDGSTTSNSRPTRTGSSPSKAKKQLAAEDISFFCSPRLFIGLLLRFCLAGLQRALVVAKRRPALWITNAILLGLFSTLCAFQGPHQVHLLPLKVSFLWYGRWVLLGVLSSIGLGTGAHTFLLFLGPLIARVTTASYICRTVDFPLTGSESLLCPKEPYVKIVITLWSIMNKIKWEAFAWGVGTAIGELPPYWIARASAMAGKSSGQLREVEQIASKPRDKRTWFETAQLASLHVVNRLGFLGILLCASVPNPLFDLAGITCGYFMVPFHTFALATFLGKAVIKAGLQSLFVVFLFSKDNLEQAITFAQRSLPSAGKRIHEWLLLQRAIFQERRPDPTMDLIGTIWHTILIAMMAYFILSVLRSVAIIQAKREGLFSKRA